MPECLISSAVVNSGDHNNNNKKIEKIHPKPEAVWENTSPNLRAVLNPFVKADAAAQPPAGP